jgi:hypothetical protein
VPVGISPVKDLLPPAFPGNSELQILPFLFKQIAANLVLDGDIPLQ